MNKKVIDASDKNVVLRRRKKTGEFVSVIIDIFKNFKPEFILFVCGLGLICTFSKYIDGVSLQAYALETADALFRGGYSGFDEIISQNLWNAPHGAMSNPFGNSNILYTIWNLPILLIHYISKTGYNISFLSRMWGKLFFVLLLLLCGFISNKIVVRITNNVKSGMMSAILLWSSVSVIASVGYAMQDEIVYIFFILMGLCDAIFGKKNFSLAWLAISCFTCPLMLVFGIPIVLFSSEKWTETIYRTVVLLCATCFQMLFIDNYMAVSSESFISEYFNTFVLAFGIGNASMLAVAVLLIYMFYWSIRHEEIERHIYLIWYLSFLSVMMYTLCWLGFYRVLICVPFTVLSAMILDNNHKQANAVFALLLFDIFAAWHFTIKSHFLRMCDFPAFVKHFFGLYSYPTNTVGSFLALLFPNILSIMPIVSGFIIALGIWLLYICYPKQKEEIVCPFSIRFLTITRSCIPIVLVISVGIFLTKINILDVSIKVDPHNLDNAKITSAIDGENYIEEYYYGKSASKLLITIIPYMPEDEYPDEQKLNLDIVDVESERIISTQSYNANELENGAKITYRIENIKIEKNHWYKFVLYSPDLIEDEEHYMYLFCSKEGSSNPQQHYANDFSGAENFDVVSRIITF